MDTKVVFHWARLCVSVGFVEDDNTEKTAVYLFQKATFFGPKMKKLYKICIALLQHHIVLNFSLMHKLVRHYSNC